MRNLLLWLIALACVLSGCGGDNFTTTKVGHVTVRITHPPKARIEALTGQLTNDMGRSGGNRHIHTSTDGAGVKREYVVEIVEYSRLRINGKEYGAVAKGDLIAIDGDEVTVNGDSREPDSYPGWEETAREFRRRVRGGFAVSPRGTMGGRETAAILRSMASFGPICRWTTILCLGGKGQVKLQVWLHLAYDDEHSPFPYGSPPSWLKCAVRAASRFPRTF